MADQVATPRGNFRFEFEIQGLSKFLLQEIDTPEVSLTELTYGQPYPLPDAKVPGKITVGDMTIRKIKPMNSNDTWVWDWMAAAVVTPNANKRPGFLRELNADNSVVDTFFVGLCWPKTLGSLSYAREGDGEKLMEEITFSVTHFVNVKSNAFKALLNV